MRECGRARPAKPARVDGRGPRPASLPRRPPRRGRARPSAGGLPRRRRPARPSWPGAPTRRSPSPSRRRSPAYFERPGAPGPIGPPRDVRHARPRGAAHRLQPGRCGVRVGLPRPGRGAATRTASSCWARPTGGSTAISFAATRKAFETPFGPLEVDHEVLDAIVRRAPADLFAAELAHRGEHSIEFQAVWLQYLRHRAGGGERRIVPLLASFAHECLARGREPGGAARDRSAVLDAVSEAPWPPSRAATASWPARTSRTSGPRFGDGWRAGPTELARVQSEDRGLLTPVSAGDAEGFFAGGAPATGPEPDLRSVADLLAASTLARSGGDASPLRAVARPRGRGHLRQRGLRGGGVAPMTEPPSPGRRRAPGPGPLRRLPDRPRGRLAARGASRSLTRASSGTSTRTFGPTHRPLPPGGAVPGAGAGGRRALRRRARARRTIRARSTSI